MNTVCLAQRHLIYSIVTCNVLSQTESLSKEQKAIFFSSESYYWTKIRMLSIQFRIT